MKTRQPVLSTERLILRPFTMDDAPIVRQLAGEYEIAVNCLCIPHPYEKGMAESWISTHPDIFDKGEFAGFAIELRAGQKFIGSISLTISQEHEKAELGYWIGMPWWGNGYCTEAGRAIIRYGFIDLGLNRIFAGHFSRNPASGRVMEKLGMTFEGCIREHVKKWGNFEDAKLYSILRREYEQI
ncbi:GNAT family N-acetyltransferase [bacterium]|nr:GNAT family N-acetyltransferase [bacterium]